MAFELPPLPNFTVQAPDPLQKAGEAAQLKNMLSEMALRQALAPGQIQQQQAQVQQAQQAAEIQRIQLQDSQAFSNYIKNGTGADEAPSDFSGRDKIATLSGMDKNDPYMSVLSGLAKSGMSGLGLMAQAQTAIQRRTEYNKGTVEQQNIIKGNYEVFKDAMARIYNADPKEWAPLVADALPRLAQATHLSPELDSLVKLLQQNPQVGVPIVYNAVAAQEKQLGLRKAAAEATEAETKAQEAAARATGQVTPEMKTAQAQEIAKAKALAPVEVSKAVQMEVQKQQALAPQLQQIASTTRAGRNYINREDIPKGSEGVVEQRAAAAGVPIVDKEVAGTLTDIDTARANMQSMLALVNKKLPQGPAERIYKGPENKLEAALQTDPDLAAMGTFRNAAIQTMRAVAGSKGLRINQAEVQMAIDNDIPKMTDTWAVAQSKVNQLNTFLDNAETAHLVHNRATTAATTQSFTDNGVTYNIPVGMVGDFKKDHPNAR